MTINCAIIGCRNKKSGSNVKLHFYRVPKVRKFEGEATMKLCQRRRTLWVKAINRKHITFESAKQHHQVCSDHFITGKPAYLHDETNPDWVPCVNLGHEKEYKVAAALNRMQRRKNRQALVQPTQLMRSPRFVNHGLEQEEPKVKLTPWEMMKAVDYGREAAEEASRLHIKEEVPEPGSPSEEEGTVLFTAPRVVSHQAVSVFLNDYVGTVDPARVLTTSVVELTNTYWAADLQDASQQTNVIMSMFVNSDKTGLLDVGPLNSMPGSDTKIEPGSCWFDDEDGNKFQQTCWEGFEDSPCEKGTITENLVTVATQTEQQDVRSELHITPGLVVVTKESSTPLSAPVSGTPAEPRPCTSGHQGELEDSSQDLSMGKKRVAAKFFYEVCGQVVDIEHDLRNPQEIPQDLEGWLCKTCNKLFFQHSLVVMQVTVDPFLKLIDRLLEKTWSGPQEPSKKVHSDESQAVDEVTFVSWRELRRRKSTCFAPVSGASGKYDVLRKEDDMAWSNNCEWEDVWKSYYEKLYRRKRAMPARDAENELVCYIDDKCEVPIYFCKICYKTFLSKSEVVEHRNSHRGSERFKCIHCRHTYTCASVKEMVDHVDTHHWQRLHTLSTNACHICGYSTKSPSVLEAHMSMHKGEKPYVCDKCGEAFAAKHYLTRHMMRHIDPSEVPTFPCDTCGKSYKHKENLRRHQSTAHKGGIKPHACAICHRRFTQKSSLHTHMRLHTGEKPYECPLCAARFCSLASKRSHVLAHSREGSFRCSHCLINFCSKRNFLKHVKTHEGVESELIADGD